jgi:hypothetical protein
MNGLCWIHQNVRYDTPCQQEQGKLLWLNHAKRPFLHFANCSSNSCTKRNLSAWGSDATEGNNSAIDIVASPINQVSRSQINALQTQRTPPASPVKFNLKSPYPTIPKCGGLKSVSLANTRGRKFATNRSLLP